MVGGENMSALALQPGRARNSLVVSLTALSVELRLGGYDLFHAR